MGLELTTSDFVSRQLVSHLVSICGKFVDQVSYRYGWTRVQVPLASTNVSTLNPMGGGPGLPGTAVESAAAAATVPANGGLSTWGFKLFWPVSVL